MLYDWVAEFRVVCAKVGVFLPKDFAPSPHPGGDATSCVAEGETSPWPRRLDRPVWYDEHGVPQGRGAMAELGSPPDRGGPARGLACNDSTGARLRYESLPPGETPPESYPEPVVRFTLPLEGDDGEWLLLRETSMLGGRLIIRESLPIDHPGAAWVSRFMTAAKADGVKLPGPPVTGEDDETSVFSDAGTYCLHPPRDGRAAWGAWVVYADRSRGFWQDDASGRPLTAYELREEADLAGYDGHDGLAKILNDEADRIDPDRIETLGPHCDDLDDEAPAETIPQPPAAGQAVAASPKSQPTAPAPGEATAVELPAKLKAKLGVVPTPQAVSLEDFLQRRFPPRGHVLWPVIIEQGLAMVYALRGAGKTFFALMLAYAVAAGGKALHTWAASQPRRVLYVDGEMSAQSMQERLARIAAGFEAEPPPGYFTLITPDLAQDGILPNLALPGGQAALEPLLEGIDLVVVDNLATLARGGKENETESWQPVQAWLLAQRRAGRSVLLVHHAGKGGDQRGTSAREDILDVVIKLSRPSDYKPDQGARFIVELTKARGIMGRDAESFEATLMTNQEGGIVWATRPITDLRLEQAQKLKALGLSIREIAEELKVPKSTVARLLNRAR